MPFPVQIYEVGEALAMFGTADFNERTNSSRAITNKLHVKAVTLTASSGCKQHNLAHKAAHASATSSRNSFLHKSSRTDAGVSGARCAGSAQVWPLPDPALQVLRHRPSGPLDGFNFQQCADPLGQ
eukprot:scaffold126582_cov15-Tisochrysis_lutea.AAC.1